MDWESIREKYPDTWLLVKVLTYHFQSRNNKTIKVIDEFEFIQVLETNEDYEKAFNSNTDTEFPLWTKYESSEVEVRFNDSNKDTKEEVVMFARFDLDGTIHPLQFLTANREDINVNNIINVKK